MYSDTKKQKLIARKWLGGFLFQALGLFLEADETKTEIQKLAKIYISFIWDIYLKSGEFLHPINL